MITEAIGDAIFIRLDGNIDPPGMQVEDITRPGVSGRAYRQDNVRGDEFELQGIVDTDDPIDLLASYKEMQGSIVSIQHLGGLYTNYLVKMVKSVEAPTFVALPVGGINDGHWLLKSVWTLVYAGG
jgi:hypothetical protein